MKSRRISIAILLALASAASDSQAPSENGKSAPGARLEHGTICILPNSPDPPTRISPGGMYNPATLALSMIRENRFSGRTNDQSGLKT